MRAEEEEEEEAPSRAGVFSIRSPNWVSQSARASGKFLSWRAISSTSAAVAGGRDWTSDLVSLPPSHTHLIYSPGPIASSWPCSGLFSVDSSGFWKFRVESVGGSICTWCRLGDPGNLLIQYWAWEVG